MSQPLIRRAFEQRLKLNGLPIGYENVEFAKPASGMFYYFDLIPATPVDDVMGSEFRFDVGIGQISLMYPLNKGTGAAEGRAEIIRDLFHRGLTLVEDDVQVEVVRTPAIAKGYPDQGFWRIPISVRYQAQIFNP